MNFAEEPTTPPVTPETPPAPAPTEPAPQPPVEPVDSNQTKIETLQNSLDAALEELSKGQEPKPVEPSPAAPSAPVAPAPVVPPPAPMPAAPKDSKDEAWRTEIANIRKGQEDFQNTTLKEIETMKLRDEMIGLTAEVQAAITRYPNADPDRILAEIESGSDKTVSQIAQDLHGSYQSLVDKISKEQEEKIKAALGKENEGKIKVPQSSGTSSTPTGTPSIPGGPVNTKATQDAAWAEATKQAKANLQ